MRFTLVFVLLLVVIVACTQAQNCRGKPRRLQCRGPKNEGRGGRGCNRNANPRMWYYNTRSRRCEEMRYLGCAGNNNRFCTRNECQRRCTRSG
ncbi:kappaPI-actitoxin-Avd3c-like [Teleopsis dalmanni]|uniref:kappaPI-actitoxin-Avd3c-like n=1 Tax=Teleopsis dalmanni TaxID=139649 RepID=UPI0018CD181D|nr:kappaPI-actitoxin-Avd3c-like [Teleopsis dalmanni]